MSLRARLLVAFLALALLPTLGFAVFTIDQLNRSTDRWYRPGVDQALESAVEVTRTALTRLEATVLERADSWAAELQPLPLDAARRSRLRDGLRDAGLDFVLVCVRVNGGWHVAEQIVPGGVLAADTLDLAPEIGSALEGSRLLRSPRGVLAAVAAMGPDAAIVTGVRLTPDFFARVEQIGQARGYYGRLAVLVDLQHRWVWLLVGALSVLVAVTAVLLARTLSRQMSEPLVGLTAAFGRVAEGDLGARVAEAGAPELRALASSFNAMTTRLAEAREGLARAEREAAWRDVARRLAHEIKNPLTPMRLSLHRLQKRADAVPERERAAVRDSLAALLQEVEHLARLAEQFSNYARLPEPRLEGLDLGEVARSAAALHEPEGLTVRVTCAGSAPVRGDRLLLSLAVHNLLLNACEASPAGATVEVRVGTEGAQARLEVLDRGPGPPAELAERVFEPYVSTRNRGSGLGLSLVRDIAVQHGGHVELSNREGGGACARLSLPLQTPNG
ncbi:MAG: HAMP domain-containing protein [Candidatus Eisenbacteria bacterium]|nr:HAMP domain-containing protein [Candidatus Eisenbacteria bacterium]